MKIVRSQAYTKALQDTMQFISLDSKARALTFKHELDTHIDNLDNKRALIFKGYTVVYKIDTIKDTVTIIGLRNTQEKLS
jgi:hypothetical protein